MSQNPSASWLLSARERRAARLSACRPYLVLEPERDFSMISNLLSRAVVAAAAVAVTAGAALALDISGAGATFPFPIYAKWADSYKKETGAGLNYQSIGSGGGIKQIKAKTVTF